MSSYREIDIETYIVIHASVKLLRLLCTLGLCTKLLLDLQVWIEEIYTQQKLSSW